MSGGEVVRVVVNGGAPGRLRGTVSVRVFYLATAPLFAFALIVLFGASTLSLLMVYGFCLLGALVLMSAMAIVTSWRRTGVWDWRGWRPIRPRPGAASVGVRVWPSRSTEALRVQWERSRWPRYVEVDSHVDVPDVEGRIAEWFPPDGGVWGSGVTAVVRHRDGTTELRLSHTRPTPTTIEGTITPTPDGIRFEGWLFGAKGHWSSPILEMVKALVPAGFLLFVAAGAMSNPEPGHPVAARLVGGFVIGGCFMLLIGWCHLMRLFFGTADASWALQHDLAALFDGPVCDVGDANPNAAPRRFRRPPDRLGRESWQAPSRDSAATETATKWERVRGAHRARILGITGLTVLLAVLGLFTLGALFEGGSTEVNPAQLPDGRPYFGYVLPDGTRSAAYIECPSFARSVSGATDDLCAPALRNSLTALAVLAVLEVLVLFGIVALNRSRRRLKTERALSRSPGHAAGVDPRPTTTADSPCTDSPEQ